VELCRGDFAKSERAVFIKTLAFAHNFSNTKSRRKFANFAAFLSMKV
jgi:hypothetical protein